MHFAALGVSYQTFALLGARERPGKLARVEVCEQVSPSRVTTALVMVKIGAGSDAPRVAPPHGLFSALRCPEATNLLKLAVRLEFARLMSVPIPALRVFFSLAAAEPRPLPIA